MWQSDSHVTLSFQSKTKDNKNKESMESLLVHISCFTVDRVTVVQTDHKRPDGDGSDDTASLSPFSLMLIV